MSNKNMWVRDTVLERRSEFGAVRYHAGKARQMNGWPPPQFSTELRIAGMDLDGFIGRRMVGHGRVAAAPVNGRRAVQIPTLGGAA